MDQEWLDGEAAREAGAAPEHGSVGWNTEVRALLT